MSSGLGSSSWGSFWAARNRRLVGVARAASSARIDDSRPTTKGCIMWGNTTMSRSGTSGRLSNAGVVRAAVFIWVLASFGLPDAGRGLAPLPRLAKDRDWVRVVLDDVFGDDAFLDVVVRRDLVHHVEHEVFDDDLQSPGADVSGQGLFG